MLDCAIIPPSIFLLLNVLGSHLSVRNPLRFKMAEVSCDILRSVAHFCQAAYTLRDRRLEAKALDGGCRPLQAMQCTRDRGLQRTFNLDNSALVS